MAYKFICNNNPEHLFEEPTFDYWCDKCPIEKRSMLVSYIDNVKVKEPPKEEKIVIVPEEVKTIAPVEEEKPIKVAKEDKSKLKVNTKVVIPVIQIGKQSWMTENLNTNTFLNKDKILHAASEKEWIDAGAKKIPAWCYPDNDERLGKNNGKIYNWYAVTDPRGLCPIEMRIPSKEDIEKLVTYLSSKGHNGKNLKSKSQWMGNGNGEDTYGLNFVPYSKRYAMGTFSPQGYTSAYWTVDQHVYYTASYWELTSKDQGIKLGNIDKNAGFFVRCLKK
jgi:uncharacterized protein (TIGR02145 family)